MNPKLLAVKNEIKKVLRGKDDSIDMVLCALVAGGHILLEDIPGVGKTTLAVALSQALSLSYKRMQFTPDVLPGDILGFSLYDLNTGISNFQPGAIFTNIFLADEINRTSPKTQSALLEVMEEKKVTVEGVTRALERPFCVIATQNPIGAAGTQRLPDSQLDRFAIRLSLGYPDHTGAVEILKGYSSENMDSVESVLTGGELCDMQDAASAVFVKDEIYDYIVRLVEKTRQSDLFEFGISPRGSMMVLRLAKACAFYQDRNYCIPEDVHEVFFYTCCHRLNLSVKARAAGISVTDALIKTLNQVKAI